MTNKQTLKDNIWFFAWAISVIALFGSLYFSEVLQYEPCELCWYQRILMYPLTVIIGIAFVKKDYHLSIYSAVLSGIGMFISLYHYSIQKISFFNKNAPSCGVVPCTGEYINWAGFITIPFLALVAFFLIFLSSIFVYQLSRRDMT